MSPFSSGVPTQRGRPLKAGEEGTKPMRESVPEEVKVMQSIGQSTGYKWQLLCAKEGKWGWIDVDVWAAEPEGQQWDGVCRPGLVLPRDMCLCKSSRDQQHR